MDACSQVPDDARNIISALNQAGHHAYLVGGCVRDLLLGRQPKDWDIATSARPNEVVALFPKTLELGIAFAVVQVLTPTGSYEVSSFREDGDYVDGRHPTEIKFSDIQGDAKRRDFTMNALYWNPLHGGLDHVVDLVAGLTDISTKVVRCVGRAEERFQEDKLRILRAARFAHTLGFSLEKRTADAVQNGASVLTWRPDGSNVVSAERLVQEITKMICDQKSKAGMAWQQLGHLKLAPALWPEHTFTPTDLTWLDRSPEFFWSNSFEKLNTFKALATRWKFSNETKKTIVQHLKLSELITHVPDKHGHALETLSYIPRNRWHPLLTGQDLMAHGIPAGREISDIHNQLLRCQLNEKITSKAQALEWLQTAHKRPG